ncbi:MAG: hypothetical protein Q4B68_08895, partial [Bacteroidales bacterium]|nr:hypothetical protein [Bacteroidales bacterium]
MAMIFAANAASSMNISGVARNHSPIKKQCTLSKRAAATGEGIMAIKKAAKRAQGGTLISNPPKGTVYENMYVNSEAYGLGWGDIYYQKVDGGLGGVDVADDGFIYVQAPISQAYIWGLGTPWIKCEKQEADVVVMHLPQLYCIDGGDNYYVQRLVLSDDGSTFVVDPSTQDVKFTWKDNKLTQVDDCLVGLCDADGEWFYMGDYNIEYTINPDKPVAKAEGAAKSLYQMTYNDDAEDLTSVSKSMVNVFKTADQLFIDHMESGLPDAVIAASISADGKTISIPTKQYLGTDANYNSHVYVLAGNAKVASQGDYTYFDYDLAQQTDLAVDEAGNAAATYPASLIVNCGRNTLYIISDIVAPRFEAKEDKAMTPADPIFTAEDVKISNNFDLVKFVIPTKDVDGNDLNVNNLYYNVY